MKLDNDGNPVKDATGAYVFKKKVVKGPDPGNYVTDDSRRGKTCRATRPTRTTTPPTTPTRRACTSSTRPRARAKRWPQRADKKRKADTDNLGSQDKDVEYPSVADACGRPYYRGRGRQGKDEKVRLGKDYAASLLSLNYKPAILKPDPTTEQAPTRQWFSGAADVVKPHGFSYVFIQACVAILILVGFESVTSMGEEAKNPKQHIPWAVLLSLAIQGGVCYLVEYFAASYFLNPGYPLTTAASATAPIGDMMKLTGAWLFGSAAGGEWFMRIEALTVFLALIGTTLACLNTGARVTYAMGRDDEVPSHFGMLHGKNLTPHRAIWTLVVLSTVIGIVTVLFYLCGVSALAANDQALDSASLKGKRLVPQLPALPLERREVIPSSLVDHHPDQQLRHVPALYADVLDRHRGLPRTPHVQRLQAPGDPGVRAAGQPRLHVVLPASGLSPASASPA